MIRRAILVALMLLVGFAGHAGAQDGGSAPTQTTTTRPGITTTSLVLLPIPSLLEDPTTSTTAPVFYADCAAVVAAGVPLPLIPGDPGWRGDLDVNGNGSVCDPGDLPAPTTQLAAQVTSVPYYENCDAAALSGATNLSPTTPGYRPALDRDGDGVACETDGSELEVVSAVGASQAALPNTGSTSALLLVLGLATLIVGTAWHCSTKDPRSTLR